MHQLKARLRSGVFVCFILSYRKACLPSSWSVERCAYKPLAYRTHLSWRHSAICSEKCHTWFIGRMQHRHHLLMNKMFCKSLKVVQGHSKLHWSIGRA